MYIPEVQKVNLSSKEEVQEVGEFLRSFGLSFDKDIDYSLVVKNDNHIIASCSKTKNILKCFAVDNNYRGEGISSTLISQLINRLFEEGIFHSFIYTKPENITIFSNLNYKLIYEAKEAALLESGIYDINSYLDKLIKKYSISSGEKAALVMNCNPFTLGHQYLIEKAALENAEVLIFVVEEEKSLFPFNIRYNLIKEGIKHLENVKVIPGGEYIISSATFPSYFLKEESSRLKAYTEIDANIFGKYFCKRLNINRRYVGNEPYCKVTNAYNEALETQLKKYGVELVILARKKYDGREISATSVRKLMQEGNYKELENILPKVTIDFLNTEEGNKIAKGTK